MFCKYFLLVCGLLYHFLNSVFVKDQSFKPWLNPTYKFFIFIDHVFLLYFMCAFCIVCKSSLPNQRSQRFSPRFSSRSFIVVGFWIYDPFLVGFLNGSYKDTKSFFPYSCLIVVAPFLEKPALSSVNCSALIYPYISEYISRLSSLLCGSV